LFFIITSVLPADEAGGNAGRNYRSLKTPTAQQQSSPIATFAELVGNKISCPNRARSGRPCDDRFRLRHRRTRLSCAVRHSARSPPSRISSAVGRRPALRRTRWRPTLRGRRRWSLGRPTRTALSTTWCWPVTPGRPSYRVPGTWWCASKRRPSTRWTLSWQASTLVLGTVPVFTLFTPAKRSICRGFRPGSVGRRASSAPVVPAQTRGIPLDAGSRLLRRGGRQRCERPEWFKRWRHGHGSRTSIPARLSRWVRLGSRKLGTALNVYRFLFLQ